MSKGISESRLNRILAVARQCYNLSKRMNYSEEFCRRMFMIGWIHDIGYEFTSEQMLHSFESAEMIRFLSGSHEKMSYGLKSAYGAVAFHGSKLDDTNKELENSAEWIILNAADFTINSQGNAVSCEQRLFEIRTEYGENSKEYLESLDICRTIGLIDTNT